jgi:hypothetical protein
MKMLQSRAAAVVVVGTALVPAAGCKSKTADGAKGGSGPAAAAAVASCNMPNMHTCRQYGADNLAMGSASLAKLCLPQMDKDAKFAMVACPTAGVIATCTKPEGKDFYYQGAEPAPDAKSCTGTFEAK